MRKLFKKALACCLVAALALTCFVGALTVSAAAAGSAVVTGTTVTEGATEATVMVTLTSEDADGIHAAIVTLSSDFGAITSVVDADATNNFWVDEGDINGNTFLVQARSNEVNATEINLNVTFKAETAPAVGTYAVAITAGTVPAASWDEVVTEFTTLTGADIVVESAVVEPVLDTNLTFATTGANIQDTLGLSCTVKRTSYSYASYVIEFVATKYNGTRDLYTADPVEIAATPVSATSAYDRAIYPGIALYELDQPIVAKIKAYDADGNYVAYSNTTTLSPVALVKKVYNASSSKAVTKTMITDMLNLGTEAQLYFGNAAKTANPDNDLLANYNNNPINKDWDQSLASTTEPTLNLVNNTVWAENAPLTSSQITLTPSLNMAATPTLSFRVNDTKTAYDASDFKLEMSYTAVYPTGIAGLKTQVCENSDWEILSNGKYKRVMFNKMTLADSNQEVTVKLYYKGDLVLTTVYTMDQGMNSLFGNASAGPIAKALAKFEAAARAHFGA